MCSWGGLMKKTLLKARYIKVMVEHYLLFMYSPPNISWAVWGIKYIFYSYFLFSILHFQPFSKQIICFDIRKQNSVLPIVFYVPWLKGFIYLKFLVLDLTYWFLNKASSFNGVTFFKAHCNMPFQLFAACDFNFV